MVPMTERAPVPVAGDDERLLLRGRARRRRGRETSRSIAATSASLERARRRSTAGPAPAGAGRDDEHVVAELGDVGLDLGARALAERDEGDHGADADDDAEHGQQRAQRVAADLAQGHEQGRRETSARPPLGSRRSSTMRPSRKTIRRRAQAAMSGSWVTMTMVMPRSRLRSRRSCMISSLVARVEVAGGLVGEQERRLGHQGAGDGHALLLAAGELGRRVVLAAGEADRGQGLAGARGGAPRRAPAVDQRQLDVLERRGARQQVEPLEHEADVVAAQQRELVAVELAHVHAAEEVLARRWGRRGSRARFMQVDLPEPLVPITATNSPSLDREVDARAAPRPRPPPRRRPCVTPRSSRSGSAHDFASWAATSTITSSPALSSLRAISVFGRPSLPGDRDGDRLALAQDPDRARSALRPGRAPDRCCAVRPAGPPRRRSPAEEHARSPLSLLGGGRTSGGVKRSAAFGTSRTPSLRSVTTDGRRRHAGAQQQLGVVDREHGLVGHDVLPRSSARCAGRRPARGTPFRVGIHGEGGRLPLADLADVGLVDLDMEAMSVRSRAMVKSTGVWKEAATVWPGSTAPREDDAVDRRADRGLLQVGAGLGERRLGDRGLGAGARPRRPGRAAPWPRRRRSPAPRSVRNPAGRAAGARLWLDSASVAWARVTEARAARSWAAASSERAVACSGSIVARTWPFSTRSLKSTRTSRMRPEVSEPTSTVSRASRVPVAETVSTRSPTLGRAGDVAGPLRPSDEPRSAKAAAIERDDDEAHRGSCASRNGGGRCHPGPGWPGCRPAGCVCSIRLIAFPPRSVTRGPTGRGKAMISLWRQALHSLQKPYAGLRIQAQQIAVLLGEALLAFLIWSGLPRRSRPRTGPSRPSRRAGPDRDHRVRPGSSTKTMSAPRPKMTNTFMIIMTRSLRCSLISSEERPRPAPGGLPPRFPG